MKQLKLATDLSLPLDAVTQTFLVVGKRGSGKSNTAARMVEQFHHAKLPFVVLDPVDTWWGLKAGRDGKPGLEALGPFEPLPKGKELREYWQRELGNSGLRIMFDTVVDAYPNALTKDELSQQTGIAESGGTFRTYLSKLRVMELIEPKEIRASDVLFEG